MKKVIYQFGSLAGWPHALAKGLRDQGVDCINIIPETADRGGTTNSKGQSNRQLKYDECLNLSSYSKPRRLFNRIRLVARIIGTGKLVHYHGGTILPYNLDVLIFKVFGIPTLISWGGGDARIIEKAAKKNPYFFRYEEPEKDKRIRKMLKRLSRFGIAVATDPEMALYMEGYFDVVHSFKAPIDLSDLICAYPNPQNSKPVFLHVPTHPFVKGTIHIAKAFEKLKKEGYQFEPILLESTMTQAEMRKKISECDVYVDELRCGSYGYTALESAGSGKPTLTYIIDEIVDRFPRELPFVNTNADSVYDNLKRLIENPQLRYEVGVRGRHYVEKYHSVEAVSKEMLSLYEKISRR